MRRSLTIRASVHLVDVGSVAGLGLVGRRPIAAVVPGLREARAMTAAPLSESLLSRPQFGRVGLVALWDDDEAIDRFEREGGTRWTRDAGWSARLEPLRAVAVARGHFPGVPDDLPADASVGDDEPVAVVTIGRLRKRRVVPFLRASAKAEAQIGDADGHLWSTGFANLAQGIVSTFSLWERGAAAHAFATAASGHRAALGHERKQSFRHAGSFVRFRPYAVRGALPSGRNPLPESVTARLAGAPARSMPESPRARAI